MKIIMNRIVLVCFFCLHLSAICVAENIYFTNSDPIDGLWSRPANWGDNKIPGSGDEARDFGNTSVSDPMLIDNSVSGSDAAECYNLNINGEYLTSQKSYLDIQGGELFVGHNFMVGTNGPYAGGVVNISGGQIFVGNQFSVGRHGEGLLTMTGGTVQVDGMLGIPTHTSVPTATGTFYLRGGAFYCTNIYTKYSRRITRY